MLKTEGPDRSRVHHDEAVAIGIQALTFIAADPVQFHRFLDLSGLDVGQIREAAAQPAFFAGLLDFILAHEPTLLAFSAEAGLAPQSVMAAREALAPAFGVVPT